MNRDHWTETLGVAGQERTYQVGGLEVPGHDRLDWVGASLDERTDKYVGLHLAETDQGGYIKPGRNISTCALLEHVETYPSIVIFVEESDQLAGTES